jgi:5'-nucleotidase (lipoprotein e(P4) family)
MMPGVRERLILTVLVVALAGCAARQAPPAATTPSVAADNRARAAPYPESIKWVREAAEYRAALEQVYRFATAFVERAAASRQAGTWAVVLDADETVISNATYQLERARQDLGFTPESWNAWVKRREATPLPGAAAFLARVRALGGRIAIVTNRLQSECDDTAAVFKAHALVYDGMLCRQDGTPSDKNPRFDAVASGRSPLGKTPLDVIAFVGDNIHDFPKLSQAVSSQGDAGFTDFGVRYFLVPNPMYGSWQ